MIDTAKLAFQARQELSLTAGAFNKLRASYLEELLTATTPDEAYKGVLAVRAIDSVMSSFDAAIETPEIERKVRENNG